MNDVETRMPLSRLLADIERRSQGRYRACVPGNWLQGRAIYGGLSAALCLHAAQQHEPELPPLRSVQLSFIGPAGGDVELRPVLDRRGKSTAFVSVTMHSQKGLAARACFCFGLARDSAVIERGLAAPDVAVPDACPAFFGDDARRRLAPNFTQHFDSRHAAGPLPVAEAEHGEFTVWQRHRDADQADTLAGLVALADALPPAAMACFAEPAPVSSMTWMFDVLTDKPTTRDGWWLCRSKAEFSLNGYSSQAMTVWNTDGEAVIVGRQNVAVFY